MTEIVIDAETQSKLLNLQEPLELRDESGRILAYVTPAEDRSIYQELVCPTSEEELDRRAREGGGRTLAEILDDLEGRSASEV